MGINSYFNPTSINEQLTTIEQSVTQLNTDLEALVIGEFGAGFVTDIMLSATGVKLQVNNLHVDVKSSGYSAYGDNSHDDTTAIQNAIDYAHTHNMSVFIPAGTYLVTGLTIPAALKIYGAGKDVSILKNTSLINPCLTLQNTGAIISDLGILGNGTNNYGANATSGDGILFDGAAGTGCSYVSIDNCRIKWHGGDGIRFTSGCWGISIMRCTVSCNKRDGININSQDGTANSGQKNAITIDDMCVCAYNGRNGIFAWGTTNINILSSRIEQNIGAGISIDCYDLDSLYVTSSVLGVNIVHNYFEVNGRGHVYVRGGLFNNGTNYYSSIYNVAIVNNYGLQYDASFQGSVGATITFVSEGTTENTSRIFSIYYENNNFNVNSITTLFDGGNCLNKNSILYFPSLLDYENPTYLKNFGKAITPTLCKFLTINGYFYAKGATYTSVGLSDDIATGSTVYFPFPIHTQSKIFRIGVYIETDSINFKVIIRLKYRDGKTINSYSEREITLAEGASGSQYVSTSYTMIFGNTTARVEETASDMYLEVVITRTVVGTYFKLGNPVIIYLD